MCVEIMIWMLDGWNDVLDERERVCVGQNANLLLAALVSC